mgnify:CR=1 FL=1
MTPNSPVRPGSFIGKNAVLMPCYVNIGAFIGAGTMMDTFSRAGSCCQIGENCHISAGSGIGGVLEPAQALPTIIEDNVSILHEVTLGGTGNEVGARHPIVRSGVLIGAGAKILGPVEIGHGAKIGAGSVVLGDVPPHTTVAGVPAEIVGASTEESPALAMDQSLDVDESLRSSGL